MRIYKLRNCGIIITKIYEKTAKKFLKCYAKYRKK